MNIYIISRGYPSVKYPMNGIFEFDQAKALAQSGHDVVFCVIDLRSIRRWRKWGLESFEKDGIPIRAINIPIGAVAKNILVNVGKIAAKILFKKTIKEFGRPDIIHAHFAEPASYIADIANFNRIPFVMTEHSSATETNYKDKKLKKYICDIYSKTNKLIAVSPALQQIIKDKYGFDSVYIPNVVDTKLFAGYQIAKENNSHFNFISVGNLIPRKRIDLVVSAFAGAFKNNENVHLTIIGEGPERSKIESIIKSNNLENKVKMLGLQTREVIAKEIQYSDCFVLPSQHETFGVVYIEAMASGLPIIATKCGGPEHFINESNGMLVDIDSLEQLKNAMLYIKNNIEKFSNKEIVAFVKEEFSPYALSSKLTDIYCDVVKTLKNK